MSGSVDFEGYRQPPPPTKTAKRQSRLRKKGALPNWSETIKAGNLETGTGGEALGPNRSWWDRVAKGLHLPDAGTWLQSFAFKLALVLLFALVGLFLINRMVNRSLA